MEGVKSVDAMKKIKNRNDHNCFGCGPRNEYGLKMEFFTDGTRVASQLAIPAHLCGWDTVAHGGVISTVLDEIMSWTAIRILNRIILTRSMSVDFLRPVMVCEAIFAEGKVRERVSEREALVEGFLYNSAGDLCAKSTGRFALFTAESAKKMNILSPELIDSFSAFLDVDPLRQE